MKNIFKSLVAFLMAGSLLSCEKNISEISLKSATPPVLSATVKDSIPLSFANQDMQAIKLNWTNPNYTFTTGVSSHDVSYTVEIDTTGANFTNPKKKAITLSKEIGLNLTQKELNVILVSDLELSIGKVHNIEMRLRSSLSQLTNAALLTSNILKFKVVPYQDPTLLPPDLYITGSATESDWTNAPPANQKFAYMGGKKYEITLPLKANAEYKLLSKHGQWQPQYGSPSSTGGPLLVNDGSTTDPPAMKTTAAGNYKITVDLGAMTYTIAKI